MLEITYHDKIKGTTQKDTYTDREVNALLDEVGKADYINPDTGKKLTGIAGWAANFLHTRAQKIILELASHPKTTPATKVSGKGKVPKIQ